MEPITYENASGEITYTLKVDLVFHYVLQRSERALINLVCALKGISPAIVKKLRSRTQSI